ncbi:hypothetical protein [Vibrio navarrensis]|uniref:hypothetical protein n=1 Tax=Vibrio navarrensis TaxID=29495 RepID=UPI001869A16C|nr:hypothetical protein [Vibrio navarrensis]MBE4617380.1 hypothetical protein [Vibrio navarrensis]
MSQELVNSVNKLTDETSALLQEYVRGNTVLQNSASDAASSAAAAKASETNSVNQANIATQKAAESKQYRDEAAAIVTGGTATVDPAPGKIPLANSQGKISSGWLTALAFARTKADMDAMRASVNRQCAASGMIHAGKHYTGLNVNEGLFAPANLPNIFHIGRTTNSISGASASNHAVMNIAGFPVNLMDRNDYSLFTAKFPQAPDGTDIYDNSGNCRGTGKPKLNLLTEVDPKYGDVATNVNEAVARAFEGMVKNGDLRNGTSGWSSISGSTVSLVDGKLRSVSTSTSNTLLYQNNLQFYGSNSYEVVIKYWSNQPITVRLNQQYVSSESFPAGNWSEVRKIISGKDGSVFNISGSGANAEIEIEYIYIRPVTEEVVTERVDLSGLEGYLEEITPAKPYIYPYGGINNQATSVDGIATTVDNVRPITYFANFTGDTTSRGRGWNLNELTDAQLLTILQNPAHHVYVIDGRLVQFRVRPRQIAGAGNGDWVGTDSTNGGILAFNVSSPVLRVIPQGNLESAPPMGAASYYYYGTDNVNNWSKDKGTYTCASTGGSRVEGTAYNGECYFYVLATTLRLNQGAYHPLNMLGTKFVETTAGTGSGSWHRTDIIKPINTLADCFINARASTGAIGQASGHPEGKFYDAIYPDGAGGVIERRLSAFPVTIEDYFKAMAKAENGTMRGMQKLRYSKVVTTTSTDSGTNYVAFGAVNPFKYLPTPTAGATLIDISKLNCTVVKEGVTYYANQIYQSASLFNGEFTLRLYIDRAFTQQADATAFLNKELVVQYDTNLSVSGNFLQTDVIGHPANILQVDALRHGWMGNFIPLIDEVANLEMSRKAVGQFATASNPVLYTDNLGVTWSGTASGIDSVANTRTFDTSNGTRVYIVNYLAAAKVTKPSAVLPVYGHRAGLGDVSASSWFGGSNNGMALLTEALMGKIPTSNTGWDDLNMSLRVLSYNIRGDNGKVQNINKHEPISLGAPANNSPAIKVLPHAAANNGQATLGFVWNEIKHDGASWNDGGTMLVIANTGTYSNLKPESCLYGYAELALPIGWVDSHARFGTQVPGVDL